MSATIDRPIGFLRVSSVWPECEKGMILSWSSVVRQRRAAVVVDQAVEDRLSLDGAEVSRVGDRGFDDWRSLTMARVWAMLVIVLGVFGAIHNDPSGPGCSSVRRTPRRIAAADPEQSTGYGYRT
jgi:hypothetical protein